MSIDYSRSFFFSFNITPCFNFTTVYGEVPTFGKIVIVHTFFTLSCIAIKYKLVVDNVVRRVGLVNDLVTNEVVEEVTLVSGPMRTCTSSHTFVLQVSCFSSAMSYLSFFLSLIFSQPSVIQILSHWN